MPHHFQSVAAPIRADPNNNEKSRRAAIESTVLFTKRGIKVHMIIVNGGNIPTEINIANFEPL
jgi:hypothetical protein